MSLKSSEINNCSWIISTVLESPFCSSSCCQACFPSIVRPMRSLWELILKSFLSSPEMNRPVLFSMHLWMTKKIDYFLRHLTIGERIFPWFNIDPIPSFPMGTTLGEEPAGSLLRGFAFAFDRHAKSFALSFNERIFFELIFGNLCFIVVRIHHKLIWSMRNSDPGVSVVSAQRHNSDLNSMFTVQITGCNFQYGPNLGVSLDPAFRLWCCFFSRKSVFTTGHCTKLCKISSVFRHEILSILNNTQKSCIHTEIHLICLVVTASQFVLHIVAIENFWYAGSSLSKGTSVLIALSTSEELDCPIITGRPVLSWRDSYSSHFSATGSVKTELVCRNNCAKNSLNRFLVGCIVYRQFAMSFAFELTSGQWSRSTENWTSALSEFQQHPFCNFVRNSLRPVFFDWAPLLSGTGTNEWPLSCTKLSCIQRYDFSVCQTFFFIVFCSTRNVVEHWHP